MGDGVFVRGPSGGLVPMSREEYALEDVLQQLVAECPDLLSADGDAGAWVLVRREYGIADADDASDRWSVDHLFLDAEGIPTLVEVKRRGDTRLRREVVGQMLDYAANAASYWTVESIRSAFERTCADASVDPDERLRQTFLTVIDTEDFWQSVRTNLDAGRLRLIFLADEIPSELRAIVEFLNAQMSPAIVQAIEVSQYTGPDGQGQTLLAKLIGETEATKRTKSVRSTRAWDKDSWIAALAEKRPAAEVRAAERVFAWAEQHDPAIKVMYGKGARNASAMFGRDDASAYLYPFYVYNSGSIEIQFGVMAWGTYPAFQSLEARQELMERLNRIAGFKIDPERIDKRPNIPLSAVTDDSILNEFIEAMDWALQRAEAHGR